MQECNIAGAQMENSPDPHIQGRRRGSRRIARQIVRAATVVAITRRWPSLAADVPVDSHADKDSPPIHRQADEPDQDHHAALSPDGTHCRIS